MMNAFLWSVRRELWENRSVYIAPLAAAAIFVAGFAMRLAFTAPSPAPALGPYAFATLALMGTGVVVAIFYCLDALYAERRDRSILFWKSLPVSDWATVLAKAAIPLLVLPLLTTAITSVVHIVMLMIESAALLVRGQGVDQLWQEVAPLRLSLELLYHMSGIHILWYAPIFAWLLLASAWARRAPFLWAGIPILAIVVVENLVFATSRFFDLLKYRFVGGPESFIGSDDRVGHVEPGVLFANPQLWIGLALTFIFLYGAVRIRRQNAPA